MNTKHVIIAALVIALAVPLATAAYAQPAAGRGNGQPGGGPRMGSPDGPPGGGPPRGRMGGPGERPGPPGMRGGPDEWRQQDLRELVEMARIMRVARDLELDEEQTVRLTQRYEAMKERMRDLTEQRREAMRALRDAVSGEAAEEELHGAMERVRDIDRELADARLQAVEELGEGFSARQKAGLYIAMQDFRRDLQRMIEQARGGRGGRGAAPMRGEQAPGGRATPPPPGEDGGGMF